MTRLIAASLAAALIIFTPTVSLTSAAHAAEQKAGTFMLKDPTIRATLPGQKVAGGYLTIHNMGPDTDRLIGGMAAFAGKVEIHEMKMDGGVMKMRALPNGLKLEAGTSQTLKPGGNHVMFMQLKEPMKEGETHNATLVFEKAGKVAVTFTVKSIGDTMKMKEGHGHNHGGNHSHSHSD